MPRTKHAATWAIAASAALIASVAIHPAASADNNDPANPAPAKGSYGDVRNVGPDYNQGKKMPLDRSSVTQLKRQLTAKASAAAAPVVGDDKIWLANDDTDGSIYAKTYTLRGVGDHIQVWVADDRAFPAGDCRNDLGLTNVTDDQVTSFVHEFDTNIYPKESKTFSTPPARDGTGGAGLAGQLGQPADYYKVPKAQADDIVVLVDNVKDANFYAPGTPDGQTYIAGFFYSVFNEYVDRNVMTIDAYDWLHRTGATPPNDTADPAYIACAQSQGSTRAYGGPQPHLYEGTFAHEYQHLLEYYVDSDEVSWVNEGISDWAQTLVGYVNNDHSPDVAGADSHIACFDGFQPPNFGGPENSLTSWGDQGGPEILCDYGAAYSFMEYLASHYGKSFMTALHLQPANGLQGLNKVLNQFGAGSNAGLETIHRWAAEQALDQVLDNNNGKLKGGDPGLFTAGSLSSKINWANTQAYDSPGAPPNGSDYVRLRRNATHYLTPGEIGTIQFKGAATLEPTPVEWTVAGTPPDATTAATTCGDLPSGTGATALYSGCGENLDRSIVHSATVPSGSGATLSFDALWDTEEAWDFGFVQVSDDNGQTWKSLPTADTTSVSDPAADARIKANLPGLTGDGGTWKTETADLSAYAGKNVLIAFRYQTDAAVNEGGFWVRNVSVGGTPVPTGSLDGWQTMSQVNPPKVSGWTVQLVGYGSTGKAWYARLKLNNKFAGSLIGNEVRKALGNKATTVAAIVTYDDPSEAATQEARYSLKVNGALQPGG
ncbi:MAG: peptidase immune inhibitor [Marmoricola sp.]|nr:peptidase immune inhibitor [Marmoricola sp.]